MLSKDVKGIKIRVVNSRPTIYVSRVQVVKEPDVNQTFCNKKTLKSKLLRIEFFPEKDYISVYLHVDYSCRLHVEENTLKHLGKN